MKKIVSVNKKGVVKGKKVGKAKINITVKYKTNKGTKTKKLYVNVTVKEKSENPTNTGVPSTQIPSVVPTSNGDGNNSTSKPGDNSASKPSVSLNPSVSGSPSPVSSESPKPSVSESPKPSTSESPKPSSSESPKPSTSESPKPSSSESPKPSTSESPKPSASESPKPSSTPVSDLDINENGLTVKNGVLKSYKGSQKVLSVPSGVIKIDDNALSGTEIESVVLPDTLQVIGDNAFKECVNLKDCVCPDSVVKVGNTVWEDCKELETLSVPNKNAKIGNEIVLGCFNLKNVNIAALEGCTHDYQEIGDNPTCSIEGHKTELCKDCGNIQRITLPALGHDKEEVVVNATCEKSGYKSVTCKRCEAVIKYEVLDKLDHGLTHTEVDTPTCESAGVEETVCDYCGKVMNSAVLPPKGHQLADKVSITKYPTCKDKGEGIKVCLVCGKNVTVEIEETGHTEGEFEIETEPTCTNKGVSVKRCTVCKEELSRKDVPATGHKWGTAEYKWSKDNTMCSASRICSNDNNHSESESVEAEVQTTNATCTENGKSIYTVKFKNTGFSSQTKEVTIDKLGHNWGTVQYTWSDDGSMCTAKRVCTRDDSHSESEIASISSGTITKKETKAATCIEEGETTYTASFSNKDFASTTKTVVDIDKKPHTVVNGGSADCHQKCSVCGATLSSEHKFTDSILVNSTCILKGVLKHTCECGYSYTSDIDYADHVYSANFTVDEEATCEGVGSKSRHCTVSGCDAKTDVTVIPATGHSGDKGNGTVTKAATCEETGTQKMVCEVCDKEYKDKEIPAKGHTVVYGGTSGVHQKCSVCGKILSSTHKYSDITTLKPTCTKVGTMQHTCDCGYSYTTAIAEIDHSYSSVYTVDKEATCTVAGSKSKHCTTSGCTAKASVTTIVATGHSGDSGDGTIITAATCTTDGKRYKRCTICKSNYGEVVINKLGHNVSSSYTIDVEPTCTAEGSKSYHCTRCSYKTGDTTIDKIDHSYGSTTYSWSPVSSQYYNACKASRVCSVCSHKQSCKGTVTKKVTTQATCTAEGKATYTATFSNSAFKTKTKEGLVAPLGHKYSVNYKWIGEGTRDYDSCKATKTCTRCGDSSSETAKSVETVEKAPTCAEGGSSRFKVTFTDSDLGSIDESHTTRSTNDHTYTGDNLYLASNSNNTMVVKDKCSVCGNRSYASTFLVFSINENTKVATNGFVGYKQNKGIMLTGLTSNTLQSAGEDGRTYSEYIYRTLGEGYTIYITRNLYNEMGSSQNYIMSGLTKYCICKIID